MSDVRDQLPPEIRDKQRKLVHARNRRILLTTVGFFVLAFFPARFLPSRFDTLLYAILAVDFVALLYALLVVIPRADARHCVRIGFVCPACSAPLYRASSVGDLSALITRGVCPRCEHSFTSKTD